MFKRVHYYTTMKNKFVIAITVILVALSAMLVVSFVNYLTKENQREQLAAQLDSLVESYKKGDVEAISISAITSFEWEKLYLFGPYTTKEHIIEVTGLVDSANLKTKIEFDDTIVLFVFVNENKIVQFMDFHRDPDFGYSIVDSPYNPDDAFFVLNENGQALPTSK